MSNVVNSKLNVVNKYYFKCDEKTLPNELKKIIEELTEALKEVKIDKYKKSSEGSRKRLFSPVSLNTNIKKILKTPKYNMSPEEGRRILCDYSQFNESMTEDVEKILSLYDTFLKLPEFSRNIFNEKYEELKKLLEDSDIEINNSTMSWNNLTKGFKDKHTSQNEPIVFEKKTGHNKIVKPLSDKSSFIKYVTKGFTGFRELDFLKNEVGIEVQFGKYAFMVYNVCAKMKIFEKKGIIKYGIEIVPTKKMQKLMSTGVSFFEQFVWDLHERGSFREDVPVVILGVEPNKEGFLALEELDEKDESSISDTQYA